MLCFIYAAFILKIDLEMFHQFNLAFVLLFFLLIYFLLQINLCKLCFKQFVDYISKYCLIVAYLHAMAYVYIFHEMKKINENV